MTAGDHAIETIAWHSLPAEEVATELAVDPAHGLDALEVQRRLEEYGPNALPTEPPPSVWVVARGQLANPMNMMLLIVGMVDTMSLTGGQWMAVIALSLITPTLVGIDKAIQMSRQTRANADERQRVQDSAPAVSS
jgi:Ca2+-transporting ATPase